MESITKFLAKKLRLKVNTEKSAVGRPWNRKFLGFTFTKGMTPKRRIAPAALLRLKQRLKEMTQRNRGNSLEHVVRELKTYMTGWYNYFKFCSKNSFVWERVDSRTRYRLRAILEKRSNSGKKACRGRGLAHFTWPNDFFAEHGLFSLLSAPKLVRQS